MIELIIERMPVPNNTKLGRYKLYKPKKVMEYTKYIQIIAKQYMLKNSLKLTEMPIKMALMIGLPISATWSKKRREMALKGLIKHKSKPDSENFAILIKNALQNIVYKNDSQICVYYEEKFYVEHPYVKIKIEEIK